MEALTGFFSGVTEFINATWAWMDSGIYQFVKDILVLLTKACIYAGIQLKIIMVDVAFTTVKEISQDIGVTQVIQQAWGQIPAQIQSTLSFFKVPQGLTLIIAAIPTRWAMRFVPGVGV